MTPIPGWLRGLVAAVFLVLFYVLGVCLALGLLLLPVFEWLAVGRVHWLVVVAGIAGAAFLVMGLISVRRPPVRFAGSPLAREAHPELFATVDQLAGAMGVRPPDEVRLDFTFNASASERGGRRTLVLGVPLCEELTVSELRATIGHELGHFAGGDTRWAGLDAFAFAAFHSVLIHTSPDPFRNESAATWFGRGIASLYATAFAWIFLRVTGPLHRRQELVADAAGAAVAGRETMARALQKIHVGGALYDYYVGQEVRFAVAQGAMPSDFREGFAAYREALRGRGKLDSHLHALHTARTDPYDSHPALGDRLRALGRAAEGPIERDDRPGIALLADAAAQRAWARQKTMESFDLSSGPVVYVRWDEIPALVYAPRAVERARAVAAKLHPLFPGATTLRAMLSAFLEVFAAGRGPELVARFEPAVHAMTPHEAHRHLADRSAEMIAALLAGALVEGGGRFDHAFGEREPAIVVGERTIFPVSLAVHSLTNPIARAEVMALSRAMAAEAAPAA